MVHRRYVVRRAEGVRVKVGDMHAAVATLYSNSSNSFQSITEIIHMRGKTGCKHQSKAVPGVEAGVHNTLTASDRCPSCCTAYVKSSLPRQIAEYKKQSVWGNAMIMSPKILPQNFSFSLTSDHPRVYR